MLFLAIKSIKSPQQNKTCPYMNFNANDFTFTTFWDYEAKEVLFFQFDTVFILKLNLVVKNLIEFTAPLQQLRYLILPRQTKQQCQIFLGLKEAMNSPGSKTLTLDIQGWNRYRYDMIFSPKWDIISYLLSQNFTGYKIISYIPFWDIISDMIWKRYEKIYIVTMSGWSWWV